MGFRWFKCSLIFLVISSFSVINSVLATNTSSPTQSKSILCHDQEKLALLHFKQSFLIDCDTSVFSTSYPKVRSWQEVHAHYVANTSIDCCKWDGVECDKEMGHVIGLDLSGSCLYGTFPSNSTLFDLDHLRYLNLAGNNFNLSQIPLAIGRLYKLTTLNLFESFFGGQIPSELANLSRLTSLDLSNNGDSSGRNLLINLELHRHTLELLFRNLTHLSLLHLDSVDISSTLPSTLSNMTSLKSLFLQSCNLVGQFPQNVFSLPNLELLLLRYNNNLGGSLPEFRPGSRLRAIDLSTTAFTGEIPPSIGKLGFLTSLDLSESSFSGTIPSSLGNLTKLTFLDLERTSFRGELPSSVTNITQLTTLAMSYLNVKPNDLNSWLLKLNKLNQLDFHHMFIGGQIPPAIVNLTELVFLDLSDCEITSPIPSSFAKLTQLRTLSLDGDHIEGPVPQWLPQLTNLESLALSFKDSVAKFSLFLKLPNLRTLSLSGVTLTFPPNMSSKSSHLKFQILDFESCNLTEFPQFLRFQDELLELSLAGNKIAGNIPQWLVNITKESLLAVNLSNNLLTGFELPSVFYSWKNLEVFDFSGNNIQGQLPTPPSSLQIYQVSNNQFSGVIPKQICNVSSLIYLDLSNNSLSGQIPDCISHQLGSSLQVLNLRGNNFVGAIPENFTRSCNLKMIDFSQNQLVGKLPKSLVNCTMLEVLDFGKNRINGTFPSWLGSLPKLQVLVLRHNDFHGRITAPESGDDFQSLLIIDLSYNLHKGSLPYRYLQNWPAMRITDENQIDSSNSTYILVFDSYTYGQYETYDYGITITIKGSETYYSKILSVFRVIDFSSNFFDGVILSVIGELQGLQALNLSNNHLEGKIPPSLAKITDLESLDLSQNRLTGNIPHDLAQLTSLEVFNVSHNYLVGSIPRGKQFDTFDNSSFDGNLALCGAPLSEQCTTNIDSPSPPRPQVITVETEDESKLIDWIVRSLGCVSGIVVGFIVGKIYVTDKNHDWFIKTFGRRQKTRSRRPIPRRGRNS